MPSDNDDVGGGGDDDLAMADVDFFKEVAQQRSVTINDVGALTATKQAPTKTSKSRKVLACGVAGCSFGTTHPHDIARHTRMHPGGEGAERCMWRFYIVVHMEI